MKDKKRSGKKWSETKIGSWLKDKAPDVLETVGDILPDSGGLGIIKRLIDKKPDISHAERMEFKKLLQEERISIEQEITKRWDADMKSDSWLSKNTRPIIVLSSVLIFYVLVILDSCDIAFVVSDTWKTPMSQLLFASVGGYFAVRTIDKRTFKRD